MTRGVRRARWVGALVALGWLSIDCHAGDPGLHAPTESPRGAAASASATPRCDVTPKPGDDDCTAPLAPASDRRCRFEFAGKTREFLLYAPPGYKPCAPTALVVDAHGATSTDDQQAGLAPFKTWPTGFGSGWRLLADREGFVVVTPQGIDNRWSEGDVDFVLEVERRAAKLAAIDPKRVFLTGISNGGYLTYWTGCRDNLDLFRGLAVVSGGTTSELCPARARARATPLIAFHAKGDTIVPYGGGADSAKMWAERSRCKRGPLRSDTFGGSPDDARELCFVNANASSAAAPSWRLSRCGEASPATTCETWDQCDDGARVRFCTVSADAQPVGGHVLYFNDTRLSLAAAAWEFFKGR